MSLLVSLLLAQAAPMAPAQPETYSEIRVEVQIEADETGLIDKCAIKDGEAPPALTNEICPIFVGKRLKVTLGPDGKAQRFSKTQIVRFRIPHESK